MVGLQSRYGRRFCQHVLRFMDQHNLWPRESGGELWVALSGGADSMGLLRVLAASPRGQRVRAVSIDHGSRPESAEEVGFCRNQCRNWGVPFQSFALKQGVQHGNWEHRWRQQREDIFRRVVPKGGLLYQGHHLNDSLEWYLMGMLKSSSREIPGIPLVNGYLRRPLLCVSRRQILRFMDAEGVAFVSDPSNGDRRFERNHIRQSIAHWEQRFPKYLKHYAQRQNAWVEKGVERGARRSGCRVQLGTWGWLFWGQEWDHGALREALLVGICRLSSQGRGSLSKEVDKLLTVVQRGEKLGPMVFSGGVWGYWEQGLICLLNEQGKKWQEARVKNLQLVRKVYRNFEQFREAHIEGAAERLTRPLWLLTSKQRETRLALPQGHPLYSSLMGERGAEGYWTSALRLGRWQHRVSWPLAVWEYRNSGPVCQGAQGFSL